MKKKIFLSLLIITLLSFVSCDLFDSNDSVSDNRKPMTEESTEIFEMGCVSLIDISNKYFNSSYSGSGSISVNYSDSGYNCYFYYSNCSDSFTLSNGQSIEVTNLSGQSTYMILNYPNMVPLKWKMDFVFKHNGVSHSISTVVKMNNISSPPIYEHITIDNVSYNPSTYVDSGLELNIDL